MHLLLRLLESKFRRFLGGRIEHDSVKRDGLSVVIADSGNADVKPSVLPVADITVQMVNGMKTLYAEAGPREKPLIVAEYKKALTLYLGSVLSEDGRPSKERQR